MAGVEVHWADAKGNEHKKNKNQPSPTTSGTQENKYGGVSCELVSRIFADWGQKGELVRRSSVEDAAALVLLRHSGRTPRTGDVRA